MVVLTQITSVTQSLATPRAGSMQQQSCTRAEVGHTCHVLLSPWLESRLQRHLDPEANSYPSSTLSFHTKEMPALQMGSQGLKR